jgi:hypothetical protein
VRIIGTVQTTEDLGDAKRVVRVPVTPQADEDIGAYMVRALKTASGIGSFHELRKFHPETVSSTVVELRFEPEDES